MARRQVLRLVERTTSGEGPWPVLAEQRPGEIAACSAAPDAVAGREEQVRSVRAGQQLLQPIPCGAGPDIGVDMPGVRELPQLPVQRLHEPGGAQGRGRVPRVPRGEEVEPTYRGHGDTRGRSVQ